MPPEIEKNLNSIVPDLIELSIDYTQKYLKDQMNNLTKTIRNEIKTQSAYNKKGKKMKKNQTNINVIEMKEDLPYEKLEKEEKLKKEKAKENGMLSLNEIYPVFLMVDDSSEEFKIIYQNDIKLLCTFNDFKNYAIYYNDLEHKTKKKLPDVPIPTVKRYIMEIYFKDDSMITITIDNRHPKFVINNRWFYQQFTNSQMINALAKIIDQIIKKRNK